MADDLMRTAGELITASGDGGMLADAIELGKSVGGFLALETSKVALGVLVKNRIADFAGRFKKAKADKKIAEDFEQTEHGATLLQEALNALLQGIDHERAEAVKKIFLGLAMNPVEESLERVQQIEIMRVASSLETWEVVLLNALERYSKLVFDSQWGNKWESARTPDDEQVVIKQLPQPRENIHQWLKGTFCSGDEVSFSCMRDAWQSLHKKYILGVEFRDTNGISRRQIYLRHGAFTEYGWRLAVHLYSTTEPKSETGAGEG